eukprot:4526451-Pyramimonas_sp.AAC.3
MQYARDEDVPANTPINNNTEIQVSSLEQCSVRAPHGPAARDESTVIQVRPRTNQTQEVWVYPHDGPISDGRMTNRYTVGYLYDGGSSVK